MLSWSILPLHGSMKFKLLINSCSTILKWSQLLSIWVNQVLLMLMSSCCQQSTELDQIFSKWVSNLDDWLAVFQQCWAVPWTNEWARASWLWLAVVQQCSIGAEWCPHGLVSFSWCWLAVTRQCFAGAAPRQHLLVKVRLSLAHISSGAGILSCSVVQCSSAWSSMVKLVQVTSHVTAQCIGGFVIAEPDWWDHGWIG